MDMKRILQAFDSASTKPVEGANDMSKFLRIVDEAAINQPQVQVPPIPPMPDIAGLQPGAPKDLGSGEKVRINNDGTVTYEGGFGTFIYDKTGKALKYTSPVFNGYGQTVDLTSQAVTQNYNSGPLSVQQTKDASGKQTGLDTSYNLGPATIRHQVDASGNLTNTATVPDGDVTHNMSGAEFTGLQEGANPHGVSLAVQMAMNHYQKPKAVTPKRNSLLKQYFAEAEEIINQQQEERKALIKQYATVIAERVRLKESKQIKPSPILKEEEEGATVKNSLHTIIRVATHLDKSITDDEQFPEWMSEKIGSIKDQMVSVMDHEISDEELREAPIDMTGDPNDPTIYGHEKANPMSLKGRIMQARAQLKDLAERAESNDLAVWQSIVRDAKGGLFMGLEQNLEQIRHGIAELAAKRKKGGIQSRGIDKNISERSVSQAQAHMMAAAAHNPEFAKKVKIKPSVAKEFNRADKGKNIKSLPQRVPKKK